MTILSNLKNTHKKIKSKKRVGRGPGSGMGKTSTRGHKGAGSRSGYKRRYGYEGGQMRLFAKLPKKGFDRAGLKNPLIELNLFKIDELYNNDDVVNLETLRQKGCVSKKKGLILRILGHGELNKKVKIEANSFSKGAIKKLEDKKIEYKEIK